MSGAKRPPGDAGDNAAITDHPYFKAQGKFASPSDIPLHYLYLDKSRPEAGVSNLVREFQRTDFGLFVEYRWKESITNDVTRVALPCWCRQVTGLRTGQSRQWVAARLPDYL